MASFDAIGLIPVLFLAFFAFFAQLCLGSWFAPGAFFALFWCGVTIFMSIGGRDYDISAWALWWIFLSAFAIFTGNFVVHSLQTKLSFRKRLPLIQVDLPRIQLILGICVILGIIYAIIFHRYHTPPLWAQFLLTSIYTGTILGGLVFAVETSKHHRYLAISSLFPVLLLGFLRSGRSGILLAISFWIAAWLSGKVLLKRGAVQVSVRHILLAFSIVVFSISMVIFLQMVRWGIANVSQPTLKDYFSKVDIDLLHAAWNCNKSSILGHLSAFSCWFQDNWDSTPPTFGVYAFAGPFGLLGLAERPYPEPFEIEPQIYTNVYTEFREAITDFTPAGALIFYFCVGLFICRYWFLSSKKGKDSISLDSHSLLYIHDV